MREVDIIRVTNLWDSCSIKAKVLFSLLIVALVTLDFGSKLLIRTHIDGGVVEITSFFSLHSSWNKGISFGLLSDSSIALKYGVFLITLLLIAWFCRTKMIFDIAWLSLIISGAIGNLLDRFLHGAVFDFLSLCYSQHCFPSFNMADVYINAGFVLMLFRKDSTANDTAKIGI